MIVTPQKIIRAAWLFLLLFLLLGILVACEAPPAKEEPPAAPARPVPATATSQREQLTATPLLSAPHKARLVELPEMALPVFRHTMEQKPTLVLMANNPFLAPLPIDSAADIVTLLGAPAEALVPHFVPFASDPPLLTDMTVSAALAAGYFSRVVWVVPTEGEKELFSGVQLKTQLVDLGAINEAEAASFQEDVDGSVVAVIRGVPWHIVHYTQLPQLSEDVVVYLDLDFFKPLYRGEIKTPLLEITYALLNTLKKNAWKTLNLIICRSNLNGLPLETRFLGNDLAEAFRTPQLVSGEPPLKWQLRKNALYLENFMQNEKIHAIYRQMLEGSPADPSVKFGLYQILRRLKRGDEALDLLAQAVATDRYYALEYLNLAAIAEEKNLPHKKLEMFSRAQAIFPDNPFLTIEVARIMIEIGRVDQAKSMIDELLKRNWSPLYFPQMKDYLRTLIAREQPAKVQQ
ncbi:MAG: hypothetical protein K0A93_07880 [Desulfuromonadaceae bacterium]|nr:hypothetical protein [Desulfuromonadaceae bacterium]